MSNIVRIKPHYHPTLAERVEDYRTLDREIKKMQKIAERLKADIIQDMGEADSIYNDFGHVIATYKNKKSSTFNKISFEIEYPGVYEEFTVTRTIKEFRLKQ